MPLRKILARLRRAEQGFSMVVTMGAVSMMLISTAIAVQTVQSDQGVGRSDRDRKGAYAAAEAGLQVYVHKLVENNAFWAQCDPGVKDGINQPRTKAQIDAGQADWMSLPDNSARWMIEMLPVAPYTTCDTAHPEDSMIAEGAPTFRIRVTGQSQVNTAADGATAVWKPTGPRRSLIATFKRKSFLDYIYFTDLETGDPVTYISSLAKNWVTRENAGENPDNATYRRNLTEWGNAACSKYIYQKYKATNSQGQQYRDAQLFKGAKQDPSDNSWDAWTTGCTNIQFADSDWIKGPLHTNDIPLLCGNPQFGQKPSDTIEISGPGDTSVTDKTKSWRQSSTSGCGASAPDVNFETTTNPDPTRGTWKFNQKVLKLPSSNTSLKANAPAAYQFVGRTTLKLTTSGILATGTRADGSTVNNTNIGYPTDGVIYVDNANCTATYSTSTPNDLRTGCGIAVVQGTYDTDLTIAAADDILIDGNIIRDPSSTAVLGLVANNFIRLNHPVTSQSNCAANQTATSATNAAGSLNNARIDAAMLTLLHSFIVDNWACGGPLGTLTVNGAIAQKYRGPVGTGSGKTSSSGYIKLYDYDYRLRVRIPPKFIDPVESAWGIQTYQEQVPAQ
jgi:hypothetical protein